MQPATLDLVQVEENEQGDVALLPDQTLNAGEKIGIGKGPKQHGATS
jgi:hypothetical protein